MTWLLNRHKHLLHVFEKSHVEHTVNFIEDYSLKLTDIEFLTINKIKKATRCPNHKVWVTSKSSHLLIKELPSDTDRRTHTQSMGEKLELTINLLSQFSGWSDDDGAVLRVLQCSIDKWQQKGGCFTSTRVGNTDNITSFKNDWNSQSLDRSWMNELTMLDVFLDTSIQLEIIKVSYWALNDREISLRDFTFSNTVQIKSDLPLLLLVLYFPTTLVHEDFLFSW